MKKTFTLLFLALFINLLAFGQTELLRIGQTPGGAGYHVNWNENTKALIVGCGTSLWVYDMTDPSNPVIKAKRPLLGMINETLFYTDDILFVAASYDGIYVIDLSSDTLAILEHEYTDGLAKRAAYDMVFTGDTLLITVDGKLLRWKYTHGSGFVKLSEIGDIFTLYTCIATRGNFVALGTPGLINGKITLFNKADLNTPIAEWQHPNITGLNRIRFADLNDSIIYICGGSKNAGNESYFYSIKYNGTGFEYLSNIMVEGFVPFGIIPIAVANIQNVDSRNDTLYVATGCAVDTAMGLPRSYVPIINASTPDTLNLIDYYNPGLWHFDVALMSGTPYAATSSEWLGVAINNIETGNPLDTLMLLETGGWTNMSKVRNDTLWVAHEGWGLAAYKIDSLLFSNGYKTNSQILHLYNQNSHYFVADFTFLNDTLIFLSSGHLFNLKPWMEQNGQPDSVGHFNITWGTSVNSINTPNGLRVIVGKEISSLIKSLTIIDPFSNDSALYVTNVFNTTKSVCVVDTIVFYAAKFDSLSALNLVVSKIENDSLAVINYSSLDAYVHEVYSIAYDNNLIAAARGERIHLFTWNGSMLSQLSDYVDNSMVAISVVLKNNYLYIADRKEGVIVLDVSDPMNPIEVARFYGRGKFRNLFGSEDIFVDDNGVIYLSDFNAGVIIIEAFDQTLGDKSNIISKNLYFNVFPNPAKDIFTVHINQDIDLNSLQLIVYDINGKQMCNRNIKTKSTTVNTEKWSGGLYFVQIISNDTISSRKIIIQ